MKNKETKQKLLEQLYAPYQKCTMCPLAFLGRTNVVFGQGNVNAKLMFIGEAPGKDEDIQGKPFVGKAGKLLNKILEALNQKREDVFITNIVKCRPPKNRLPGKEEAQICKDLLLNKQIEIIQPKVICTLGACALENLLGKPVTITKIRGIPISIKNIKIIPTLHPAYTLRNPSAKENLISDIKKAIILSNQI